MMTANYYFADWEKIQQLRKSHPDRSEFLAQVYEQSDQANVDRWITYRFEDDELEHVNALCNAQIDYEDVRTKIAEEQRTAFDECFQCIFYYPNGESDMYDDLAIGCSDCEGVWSFSQERCRWLADRFSALDLTPLEEPWKNSTQVVQDSWLSEFAEFRIYIQKWTELFEKAASTNRGIIAVMG